MLLPLPAVFRPRLSLSSQINLSWTDNSNNETGFKIDRATNSTFTAGLTTVTVGSNVTTYSATGLSSSTTYYYRVRAYNANGDSANTSTASATTQGTVPAAPSGLAATAVSSSQINLSWTDNSNNETGFKIDQATNSTFTAGLTTVTLQRDHYSAPADQNRVQPRCANAIGDSANTSTGAPTKAVPAAPSGLAATTVSSSQINLAWTDNSNNETGFKIDRATSCDFSQNLATMTIAANVTSYGDTGLSSTPPTTIACGRPTAAATLPTPTRPPRRPRHDNDDRRLQWLVREARGRGRKRQ